MAKTRSVTDQARRLTNGQINRRRFIMSAVASGVTLPTATALATKAQAQAPRTGGTLRIATAGLAAEPASAFSNFMNMARGNTLLRVTSAGRLSAELATSVDVLDEHRWRLTLRENVRFHDGTLLTPSKAIEAMQIRGSLRVEDIDDAAGTLTLASTSAGKLRDLTTPASVLVHPEHGGTGGYILVSDVTEQVTLQRHADYWKKDAAYFDAVSIKSIPDAADRHKAIMIGDVDFADGIAVQAVAAFHNLPTLNVLETPRAHHLAFPMRDDVSPFHAGGVRDAIAHALDGQAIVDEIALGHGTVLTEVPIGTAFEALSGPLPLHLCDARVPGSLRVAQVVQRHARGAGLDIALKEVAADNWDQVTSEAGWHITAGSGSAPEQAVPRLELSAFAAFSSQLAHPSGVASKVESDAFRIADRWWFAAEA